MAVLFSALAKLISDAFDLELMPNILYEYPSLEALAEYLYDEFEDRFQDRFQTALRPENEAFHSGAETVSSITENS